MNCQGNSLNWFRKSSSYHKPCNEDQLKTWKIRGQNSGASGKATALHVSTGVAPKPKTNKYKQRKTLVRILELELEFSDINVSIRAIFL